MKKPMFSTVNGVTYERMPRRFCDCGNVATVLRRNQGLAICERCAKLESQRRDLVRGSERPASTEFFNVCLPGRYRRAFA